MSNVAQQLPVPVNVLLSHLPVHERNAIHRASEMQFYTVGEILLSAHTHSHYVFFPLEVVASVVRPLRDHLSVEIGLIGNEGMIGLDVIMDAKTQNDDTVVQSAGSALRMPEDDLLKQFHRGGSLQKYLLRFTHAFLGQVAQNAVCNRFHPLHSRMAKWLLMINDRSAVAEVHSSPALMGSALGADADEVEQAISRLALEKGVRQRRNSIAIDRDRLELSACECYETLRESYGRTLAS
jgi:signal-transduction protein with cAMP-binding, CBS, and nucleotidyltransferase domain